MAACVAACAAKGIAATALGQHRRGNGQILSERCIPQSGVNNKVAFLARGQSLVWRRKTVRRIISVGGGRRCIGVSRARVDLEPEVASAELEKEEEEKLWPESEKSNNNGSVVVGVEEVATDDESADLNATSNGAAKASNGAVKEAGNGSVSANGSAYSNGAANGGAVNGSLTNGAARTAADAVKEAEVISKVESIEQEDPWFKKASAQ